MNNCFLWGCKLLRLLANENIPRLLIEQLRQRSHDVRWIREDRRGISDPAVLADAMAEHRILLTIDKDFGEFVFRHGLAASCGIVLLRVTSSSQAEFAGLVTPILDANEARWVGHFSVISNKRIRVVALPRSR
jgi:predicted nuclease of predicted toxin-antitoxin system